MSTEMITHPSGCSRAANVEKNQSENQPNSRTTTGVLEERYELHLCDPRFALKIAVQVLIARLQNDLRGKQ